MADPRTLGQRREVFTLHLARLLIRMAAAGNRPRLDETKRARVAAMLYGYDEKQCLDIANLVAASFPSFADEMRRISTVLGSTRSVHLDGLAADIQLWRDGQLLEKSSDHAEFGAWWKALDPLCCWGGDWGDGGHYSLTPDGVRK